MGIDRVLFSVDYPFNSNVEGVEFVRNAHLSEADRDVRLDSARQLQSKVSSEMAP